MGAYVHAHDDPIGVEGDWNDDGSVKRPLGESRGQSLALWAKDLFVDEIQDSICWAQVEHQRLNQSHSHGHQLGSNFD